MSAYLILFVAVLSRLFPHALHGVGLNVTAVGGSLLFFGARRPRREILFAVAALAATDLYLTTAVFHYPFDLRDYALTWLWYAAVPLLGRALLNRTATQDRPKWLHCLAAVTITATSFFLLSNLAFWALGTLYPHTVAGLAACFVAALPFYRNDLASTTITAAFLFGLPELARKLLPESPRPHTPA